MSPAGGDATAPRFRPTPPARGQGRDGRQDVTSCRPRDAWRTDRARGQAERHQRRGSTSIASVSFGKARTLALSVS